MSVAERDFPHFPAKVLQILPGDLRRQVLDDEAVLGAKRRRATAARRRSPTKARVAIVAAIVAAAAATVAAAAARTLGEFDSDALAVETFPVEVFDGVFGVAEVVELDEAETSLQDDVADTPVAFEETLQIRFSRTRGKSADEKTSPHFSVSISCGDGGKVLIGR